MNLKTWAIIAGAIIALIILLCVGAWLYDLGRTNKTAKADNDRLTAELNQAKLDTDKLKAQLNEANRVVVVYKPIPGQPAQPIKPGTLSLQASDSAQTWHFAYPPGTLSADTLIDRAIQPYKESLADCMKVKQAKPKFARWTNEADLLIGRSIPGYRAEGIWVPGEIGGSGFHAGAFVGAYADYAEKKGSLTGGVWAGIILGRRQK